MLASSCLRPLSLLLFSAASSRLPIIASVSGRADYASYKSSSTPARLGAADRDAVDGDVPARLLPALLHSISPPKRRPGSGSPSYQLRGELRCGRSTAASDARPGATAARDPRRSLLSGRLRLRPLLAAPVGARRTWSGSSSAQPDRDLLHLPRRAGVQRDRKAIATPRRPHGFLQDVIFASTAGAEGSLMSALAGLVRARLPVVGVITTGCIPRDRRYGGCRKHARLRPLFMSTGLGRPAGTSGFVASSLLFSAWMRNRSRDRTTGSSSRAYMLCSMAHASGRAAKPMPPPARPQPPAARLLALSSCRPLIVLIRSLWLRCARTSHIWAGERANPPGYRTPKPAHRPRQ